MANKEKTNSKNLFDAIEGYYIISILHLFQKKGSINYTSGEINLACFKHKDTGILFRLLHERTDLLIKTKNNQYLIAKKYRHYLKLGFHIDKFISTYGHFDLSESRNWIKPADDKYAEAFSNAGAYWDYSLQLNLLNDMGARSVLDLGCGCATMLIRFCEENSSRTGIGIEKNIYSCSIAGNSIKEKKLNKNIQVIHGDASRFSSYLSHAQLSTIDVVTACSFLNEFFEGNGEKATGILKELSEHFPGRKLLVVDYYGTAKRQVDQDSRLQYNYMHDTIQELSGQGLPPPGYKQWNRYYTKAGCVLEHVVESASKDIQWFIHIVRLAG